MASPSKRREMDVMKLMMSDYAVETINDGLSEFNVEFHGPKDSLYEGGVWKIRVELPDAYPYKSPSVGFMNKIYHPNVDEMSGSVCLDVINQSWSPMFDLLNVFEVFLPQLLLYPNPSDPLNGDAASLMMKDKKQYEQKVKEYCERYAKKEKISKSTGEEESDDDEDDISVGATESSDDEIAGQSAAVVLLLNLCSLGVDVETGGGVGWEQIEKLILLKDFLRVGPSPIWGRHTPVDDQDKRQSIVSSTMHPLEY
ncbi:hypothetical protein MLD38_032733 [Melastoma candidum]|uniref:Uncharacterized protein n=1 Tax=Melastoma candidum TaxID=119954 RepID=A0ACB9M6Y6_9MYRT|nr:hypothetical protein MLD38_032733 [Melastoma candidum]